MFFAFFSATSLVDVEAEKQHQGFVTGIESFDKTKLCHSEPAVKNPLPDEKSMYNIELRDARLIWYSFLRNTQIPQKPQKLISLVSQHNLWYKYALKNALSDEKSMYYIELRDARLIQLFLPNTQIPTKPQKLET